MSATVALCVCTYKRPDYLKRLLDSLIHLRKTETITLFVADNDAVGRTGLDFIEANRNQYPFEILCEVEPAAGISHARNRTLAMLEKSGKNFDYVAFTDDDIEVTPQWIHDLVKASNLYDADVVFGKREPLFETVPPKEILESSFFQDDFACGCTGTVVPDGATCNALLRAKIFKDVGYNVFDTALTLTGGEDADFFAMLKKKGYKLIQCASALVYEIMPENRLNEKWILTRYTRSGWSYAYVLRKHGSTAQYLVGILKKIIKTPLKLFAYLKNPNISTKAGVYNYIGFFRCVLGAGDVQEYKR
ncbi:MAG: hypothetical protein DI551_07010 [Micavibrio aeruginosavorus]|uniref:Glycosyltransferase 2-like domain-containing protein n=1 Tax=Micavibrio aeruginosavorus TaxID=349221 RepID=A0A2W5MXN4_9BACT|nr:MAG: hypothetical protein DI551_07010 [Micavibrio aeruginosavorus]